MKRLAVTLFAIVAVLFATLGVADATTTWGNAQTIPGLSALGNTGFSDAGVILCPIDDLCAVVGTYSVAPGARQGFASGVSAGTWIDATDVIGLAALNTGGDVNIAESGCSSSGYCVIAGTYSSGPSETQGFVLPSDGSPAIAIPGLVALNVGLQVTINGVGCSSSANCVVVGTFAPSIGVTRPFIADQVDGIWQNPISLGTSGELNSVSCWADGECVAVGALDTGPFLTPATIRRTGGNWSQPYPVPGTGSIGTNEGTASHVSCPAADTCVAIGTYETGPATSVFTTSLDPSSAGIWSNSTQLPGIASLATGGFAAPTGLSCWSATNCLTAGGYTDLIGGRSWTAEISNGVWGDATDLAGISSLSSNGSSNPTAMTCAPDGMCAVVGSYVDGQAAQGFVAMRNSDGTMVDAIAIPGLAALNTGGYGDPKSVSCTIGWCGISGFFKDGADFVAFAATLSGTPDPEPTTTTTTVADQPVAPAFTG